MIKINDCSYSIQIENKIQHILQNISFEIHPSSITLINGRSGSGKTTLIHCLAGLIVPQSGCIFFNSSNICEYSDDERAKYRLEQTGVVYQSFNFLPSLSIRENIHLPAILTGQTRKIYDNFCNELSEELGIINTLDQAPNSVSGGELQRAALVRALMNRPKIIFADEPSGNLDTANRDILFKMFIKIKEMRKTSIVFTSHDPEAKDIADQIIELDDGRLI